MESRRTLPALLVAFSLWSLPAREVHGQITDYWPADSWPQWRRDPAKNAFNPASTLPDNLPETFWRFPTPANAANSSPAVVNGKVFFGSDDGRFYCVKQISPNPSGELLWSYRTGGRIWSAPAVAYSRVYIASLDGFFYCLKENPSRPPEGEVIWKAGIGPIRIMTSSPCLMNGKAYVGSETGYLYCFDALSEVSGGKLLWKFRCGGWIHGSPAVADGRVYVGTGGPLPPDGYRLFCLKAETENPEGELIWSFRIGDKANGMFITPAIANGKVYSSADDGWLRCLDAVTGAVVWQRFVKQMDGPSPALAYGRLYKSYESRAGIDCWEAEPAGDLEKDGELIWSYVAPEVDRTGATVADGKVLHLTWYDKLYCYDARANERTLKWTYSPIDVPAQQVGSAPSIAGGIIFLGDGNGLRALRQKGGNIPPAVSAAVSSVSGLTVSFAASGTDLDGSIASYSWRFGDGEASDQQNPTHFYPRSGSYIAGVTITDDQGAKNEATVLVTVAGGGRTSFHRGDANADGETDIADAVRVLLFLFLGGEALACRESGDADNDGAIDLPDVVWILTYLFLGGPPPEPPGPPGMPCGPDPDPPGSSRDLGCERYVMCLS